MCNLFSLISFFKKIFHIGNKKDVQDNKIKDVSWSLVNLDGCLFEACVDNTKLPLFIDGIVRICLWEDGWWEPVACVSMFYVAGDFTYNWLYYRISPAQKKQILRKSISCMEEHIYLYGYNSKLSSVYTQVMSE